jgi:hypothetical protein
VVPPKSHHFLWLLSHNKQATVDNLNRKGFKKSGHCCFCDLDESINHSFFDCDIAKADWSYVCEFLGYDMGSDYLIVVSK